MIIKLKWGFPLLFILILQISAVSCFAAEISSINSSGVMNRSISVDPTGRKEGYSTVIYNNTNGLPASEANAIAETSDGFIWIGSYAGLIRYDGDTFERIDSTTGIASVRCLYVDSLDRLWMAGLEKGYIPEVSKGVKLSSYVVLR